MKTLRESIEEKEQQMRELYKKKDELEQELAALDIAKEAMEYDYDKFVITNGYESVESHAEGIVAIYAGSVDCRLVERELKERGMEQVGWNEYWIRRLVGKVKNYDCKEFAMRCTDVDEPEGSYVQCNVVLVNAARTRIQDVAQRIIEETGKKRIPLKELERRSEQKKVMEDL